MEGITVLSLFDGISCGQLALKRAGIPIQQYYASEIKSCAINTTQRNFPDTIQLGDVTKIHYDKGVLHTANGDFIVGKIDLLIGGSPCQDFSMVSFLAGKTKYGLEGDKSKLFYEFLRLKNEINPTYFLLENVKMKKDSEQQLNDYLGVEGVHINSNLLSYQNRERIYWSNLPVGIPVDANINFQNYKIKTLPQYEIVLQQQKYSGVKTPLEVSEPDVDIICRQNEWLRQKQFDARIAYTDDEFVAFIHSMLREAIVNKTKSGYKMWADGEGRARQFGCKNITEARKVNCLVRDQGGFPNSGLIRFGDFCRKLTKAELAEAQTVPLHYLDYLSYGQVQDVCGDGWTVEVIAHIFSNLS